MPLAFCPGGESGVPRSEVRKERPAWLRRGVRGGSEGVRRRRRGAWRAGAVLGEKERVGQQPPPGQRMGGDYGTTENGVTQVSALD